MLSGKMSSPNLPLALDDIRSILPRLDPKHVLIWDNEAAANRYEPLAARADLRDVGRKTCVIRTTISER